MTIVACQNNTPSQFMFAPFSSPRWARDVANFPVVKIEKPTGLNGLALFLSESIPATHRRRSAIVTCYGAEGSERKLILQKYANRPEYAENVIKCYSVSETERAVIQDWDFGLFRHGVTPEQYWVEQAEIMISAGVEIVKIRASLGAAAVELKLNA